MRRERGVLTDRLRTWTSRSSDDAGISLAESLIAMVLIGLLGTILMNAFVSSTRGARHVADDATVQQEQQTVVERLTRDLREAHELLATTTNSQLVMWVDFNSDYAKQTGEIVTWKLQTSAGKCQLVRSTDAGVSAALSSTVGNSGCESPSGSSAYAFTFFNPTGSATYATATGVSVSLSFRASSSSLASARSSVFSVRMRNVWVS